MDKFILPINLRWSDLDPNDHARHSVYYDFGAASRIAFFRHCQVTTELLRQLNLGPILFREEAVFRKELRLGDQLSIDLQAVRLCRDFSRFSLRHRIFRDDHTLCATLNVDGAWIDTQLRKLTRTGPEIARMAEVVPKADDFQWIE